LSCWNNSCYWGMEILTVTVGSRGNVTQLPATTPAPESATPNADAVSIAISTLGSESPACLVNVLPNG